MGKILPYISRHRLINLTAYFAFFFVCTITFVEIADEVIDREILWLDEAILRSINTYTHSLWDAFFVVITQLGGAGAVITISLGLMAHLTLRQNNKAASIIGASVAGAALLNVGLKLLFERARPDLWEQLALETSFSFPSGHSMISAALGLAIVFIYWGTRFRWYIAALAGLYILVIGFSRLYLGVHYPTDILAGWCVSGAWVTIVAFALRFRTIWTRDRRLNPSKPTE